MANAWFVMVRDNGTVWLRKGRGKTRTKAIPLSEDAAKFCDIAMRAASPGSEKVFLYGLSSLVEDSVEIGEAIGFKLFARRLGGE